MFCLLFLCNVGACSPMEGLNTRIQHINFAPIRNGTKQPFKSHSGLPFNGSNNWVCETNVMKSLSELKTIFFKSLPNYVIFVNCLKELFAVREGYDALRFYFRYMSVHICLPMTPILKCHT